MLVSLGGPLAVDGVVFFGGTVFETKLRAYAASDGKKLWETFIPQRGVEYVNYKNGFASATPATDGQLVYASFGRHGLFAFDFNGKIVWQHKFGVLDNFYVSGDVSGDGRDS